MAQQVVIRRQQIDAVKAALASVRSNGQAVAAARAAVKAGVDLARHLRSVGGPFREAAAKDLDSYAKRVQPFVKSLDGNPTGGVGEEWVKAKEQILSLYMLALVTETTMPDGAGFGDGWTDALKVAVAELPATIGTAVQVAAKAATTVVTETAKIAGGVGWGLVKGAWPLLLIAALVLGGVVAVKAKLLKAAL